ncbi:PDZ domain-containing protein [Amycolatopsis alkalitolerans]|uniref:PDZ domain-containing protein n=2 Tax=Amycolatopsis alkalitolerans TaxID=2547244 RepID=A0A5C4M687_9PSEU|nr:PDZ domain-containing protein [Amycolatopsis alkalitolerans]
MAAVLLAALIGAAFLVGGLHRAPSMRSLDLYSPGGSSQNTTQSLDASAVADKVKPGLVDINTTLGYQNAQAAGTGMVLTPGGEVLTNNHVVEGATSISVTDIGNGKTYRASVVGYDRSHDVAVLQLQGASGLATVTTGDSSQVKVGDAIVGIGNAGGTGGAPSVAPGTVTALDQSITASDQSTGSSEKLQGLIQVDANIQSGDSGGALADANGHVVGMNTAASSGYQFGRGGGRLGDQQGQDASSTGYAIPINQALSIAKQIEAKSASSTVHIGGTAFLGVSVADSGQGAIVQQVVSGAPAAQAGLSAGDVLTGLNGQTIGSATTLTTLMDGFHPGDKVTLSWIDQTGQQQSATVTLAEGPAG